MRYLKIHGVLGGAAVITAVFVAIGAQGAHAHTPSAADSCSGLEVNFQTYEGDATNNEVRVTIDGQTSTFTFGTNFARTFPWAQDESHTWSVVLDANVNEGDPGQWDYSTSGSESPCVVPTTTVPDTTSTTVPDTTSTTVPDSTSTTVVAAVTAPPTTPAPTTAVAVAPPVPGVTPVTPAPTTVAPPVVPATLPQTGSTTTGVAIAGLALLAAGALGVIVARRQREHA